MAKARKVETQVVAALPEVELMKESLSAWGALMGERLAKSWETPELPEPEKVPGRENQFVLKAFAEVVPGALVVTHLVVEVPNKGPVARVTVWFNGIIAVTYDVWSRDGVLRVQRPQDSWKGDDGRWYNRPRFVTSNRFFYQVIEDLVRAAVVKVHGASSDEAGEISEEIPY